MLSKLENFFHLNYEEKKENNGSYRYSP